MSRRAPRGRHVSGGLLLGAAAALVGCSTGCVHADDGLPSRVVSVRALVDPTLRGVSDATAVDGGIWVVGERERKLWRLGLPNGELLEVRTLNGLPRGTDAEALVWLGDGRFLLGTERLERGRTSDLLYFLELTATEANASPGPEFDYTEFGLAARRNEGIEALCRQGDSVVAVSESVGVDAEGRFAPTRVFDLKTNQWVAAHRLRLTSDEGKIAGAHCDDDPRGIRVTAIERHYFTSRLIEGTIPRVPPMTDVSTKPLTRLPTDYNAEGLVAERGAWFVITDNDNGGLRTETVLIEVTH